MLSCTRHPRSTPVISGPQHTVHSAAAMFLQTGENVKVLGVFGDQVHCSKNINVLNTYVYHSLKKKRRMVVTIFSSRLPMNPGKIFYKCYCRKVQPAQLVTGQAEPMNEVERRKWKRCGKRLDVHWIWRQGTKAGGVCW